ncbi:PREDICTED: SKI family transcriptional corepressor 2-like [Nelumbo nucifera]|uniref:SKI/DACH domain-containing protein 1-like n=2 Tax=Nelumbo nucifera TaxID=4432 RepID=A0A822YSH2_NELNU|nr:PREDICTED: SKI family transcriptional corepressor 2-like [Nelumbo nucifera]DAD37104.1 TPA_asm: hypothetical protein HUJ06_007745 [Nelumbo nucifera]
METLQHGSGAPAPPHATHHHMYNHPFLFCPHHHCHHHHHHHHHHPFCRPKPHCGFHVLPFHPFCHIHLRPCFSSPPPFFPLPLPLPLPPTLSRLVSEKPEPGYSLSIVDNQKVVGSESKEAYDSGALGQEDLMEKLEEEEEEEEPVFVMTDEWMEFFAKSEAKRRQEKKQAKNKGKK